MNDDTYSLLTLKVGSLDAGCILEVTRQGLDSRGLCGMPVGRVFDYNNAIVRGDTQDGWWDPECSCSIVVKAGSERDYCPRAMLFSFARGRMDKRVAELDDIKRRIDQWLLSYNRMNSQLPGLAEVKAPGSCEVEVPGSDEAVYGKADTPAKTVRARRYALAVMDDTLVCGWQTTSEDVAEALIGMVDGELPLPDARACDTWEAAYVWVADGDPVDDHVSELADEARRNIMKADLLDDEANELLAAVNSWEEDFDEDDDAAEESDEADDDDDDEDDEFVECTRYAFVAWEENGDIVVELQDRGSIETFSSDVGEVVQADDVYLHAGFGSESILASVCIPEGDELDDDDVLERLIESATEALRDAGCEDDFGHNPIDLVVDAASEFLNRHGTATAGRARTPSVQARRFAILLRSGPVLDCRIVASGEVPKADLHKAGSHSGQYPSAAGREIANIWLLPDESVADYAFKLSGIAWNSILAMGFSRADKDRLFLDLESWLNKLRNENNKKK